MKHLPSPVGWCRSLFLILIALLVVAPTARAEVFTIHGSGAAIGSAFFPLERAFDDQPTADPPTGETYTSTDGGAGVALYTDRVGYIDLGPDYATLRITGTWTLWKQYGRNAQTPLVYWWARTKDAYFDIDDQYVTASGFGFITHIPPNNPTTNHVWHRDYNGPAITPTHRYLMVKAPGGSTNGAIEFAITGYVDNTPPPPPPPPTNTGVIGVVGAGAATGSQFFPLERAFDDQPSVDPPTQEQYLSTDGGAGVALYDNRQGYIDFGTNYNDVQITGTWTLWRQWGRTAHSPSTYWWSNSKDKYFDPGDIAENTPGFGFITFIPPANPTSNHVWHRDYDGPPITPQGRYLILSAGSPNTNGAMEFALTGSIGPAPVTPPPAFGALTLVDEVNCGDPNDPHGFQEHPVGASSIQTILGKQARVLPNDAGGRKYFAYRLGLGKGLVAGKGYVLSVEFPDDVPRTITVLNNGAEITRTFTTGHTVGDALEPPYVNPNPESILLPQSGRYQKWQTLFHLHQKYPTIKRPRGEDAEAPRNLTPADGFWVIIAQFRPQDAPFSAGAAVTKISLYEAPAAPNYYAPLNLPPAGLPQRHLFYREEMADGVVMQRNTAWRGVDPAVNWYEYHARLMKFLGMNTFTKDLLEFGANQGWDSTLHGGNAWVYQSMFPQLWSQIITMVQGYGLNVMPYYEYCGSVGGTSLALAPQKRALPLTRDDAYTHISWTEGKRADLTDPDTIADFKKMLDCTILPFADDVNFVGAWMRPRSSQLPIGFAPATLARFAAEANNGVSITRDQLKTDSALLQRYYDWWMLRRRQFINQITDYLRANGVENAVTLYTSDASEPGRSNPKNGIEYVVAEDPEPWFDLGQSVMSLDRAVREDRHWGALTLPRRTFSGWEWQHADPWNDPHNYVSNEKGMLTYTFNHAYTVAKASQMDAFRSPSGLAMIRHYALNEDTMTENGEALLGYFVSDAELAGPHCMLAEARAVAHGDPRYIGYLASGTFNRGFPEYVRAFNQAFLALPALPSTVVSNAATDPAVVVRRINAGAHGTYLAIVNTSVHQVNNVEITLPVAGTVTDLVTNAPVPVTNGKITLTMYAAQLRSLRIN